MPPASTLGRDAEVRDARIRDARMRDAKIRQLYDAHGPALLGYLRRLSRDYYGGEDLMQETMLRAFLNADRLWPDESAQRGWLFRVARNLALTNFARVGVVVDPSDEAHPAADPTSALATRLDVARCVRRLSPTQRRVFYEVFYLDHSVAEAATALRVTQSTVRTHLDVGLARLRRSLGDSRPTNRPDG